MADLCFLTITSPTVLALAPVFLLIYMLLLSAISFCAMGIDKHRALRRRRRIPEWVLLTLNWLGGSFGVLLGMVFFHHKINRQRHPAFAFGAPLAVAIHSILLGLATYVRHGGSVSGLFTALVGGSFFFP